MRTKHWRAVAQFYGLNFRANQIKNKHAGNNENCRYYSLKRGQRLAELRWPSTIPVVTAKSTAKVCPDLKTTVVQQA